MNERNWQRLAYAILKRGLNDAYRGKDDEVIDFDESGSLGLFCELGRIDPMRYRKELKKEQSRGKRDRARKEKRR